MVNGMTVTQLFLLGDYLKLNRRRIQSERPGFAAVATAASAELGFACTEDNVLCVAEACEIEWVPRRNGDGPHDYALRIIARALVEIADALDVKVDRDVRRIAMGRRVEGAHTGAPDTEPHA